MIEKQLNIPTKDGGMDTFICHPERSGPYAPIIFYMDAPGIREELRDMARRLATAGFYVLLPNLYYRVRQGIEPLTEAGDLPSGMPRIRELIGTLTNRRVMDDTEALLTFVDHDPAARPGPLGCVGYCMSGRFVICAAGTFPDRVAAAASFYGVDMATDQPDSAHLLAPRISAEVYIACAEVDPLAPARMVEQLRSALAAAGTEFEVEDYPGTEHGFAFPGRDAFDRAAADRHWERLFALFRRRLS